MGDTEGYRVGKSRASESQVAALQTKLMPGDAMRVRHVVTQ
jgi:hypothetical protein